jgi:phosphoribosyl-dephospho-CoA transferase
MTRLGDHRLRHVNDRLMSISINVCGTIKETAVIKISFEILQAGCCMLSSDDGSTANFRNVVCF